MRKRPFSVEWHVAESDAEWETIRADQHAASPSDPRSGLRRWLGTVMLLVAIGVGGWYWQHDQRPSETNPTANALAGSATALEVTTGITGTRQVTATTVTTVVLPNRQELFTPDVVRMLEHPEEGIHAHLHIPFLCTEQDRSRYHLRAWSSQPPPTTLPWLNTPHYIDEDADHQGRIDTLVHPGAAIALATVVEYIVSTHGHAALPEFLRNVGRYDSWDELIPGQFGMTTTEFEAAWQKFIQS